MPLDPGTRLGQYEILAAIGAGGMGEVYRARDTRLGRDVAIKILTRHLQRDSDALARFQREARAVSALNHPHILTIHEISKARLRGERWATPFIVSEFIDGETLRARFGRNIELRTHFEHLAQVADALAKAHAAGIVHRDLKPENIMVNSDGYAKVLDFGLAKLIEPRPAAVESGDVTALLRTSEGLVVGTSGYMAPEQVNGRDVDPRSDVFAFGCILYETACGHRPFDADTHIEVLYRILHVDPPLPPPAVSSAIRDLISRCLQKNPADRVESMREIADTLRQIARSEGALTAQPARAPGTGRSSVRARSIAVLPFENASDDPQMEYLSDGLTESIIHTLSQVRRLRVMARTTVFTYKGRHVTPQQVGDQLNVRSVITGKVQKIDGRLIANIELVDTRDGTQIWGERYSKPFSDIFAIQEEISTQISSKLKIELSGSEKRRLAKRPTRKSAAYELYLKGRYYAARRTPEFLYKAVDSFENAVAADPRFALAHSGLAEAYMILAAKSFIAPGAGYPRAEAPARKAIELDPALAEPHATIGLIKCLYDWNWDEAEREFQEAIRLNPNNATTYHWYAEFLTTRGRHAEAISSASMALDLDPLSLLINVHLADTLHFAGRHDEAIDRCQKVIELDPSFAWSYLVLGRVRDAKGDYTGAADAFRNGITAAGPIPELLAGLGHAQAKLGRNDEAEAILQELKERSANEFVSPHFLGEVLAGLGRIDEAVEKIDEYFRQPSGELTEVLVGPKFAEVRKHPRYATLVHGINRGGPEPRLEQAKPAPKPGPKRARSPRKG